MVPAPPATSTVWRIALVVLVFSGVFWLGAINVRALIGNDMLKPGTVEFEEYLSAESEHEVFRLIAVSSIVVGLSYVAVLISATAFLITSPFKLKENGWLMMCAILFYIFVPVEAYTIFLDWKMIYKEFFTTADNTVFRELFLARIRALAGAPVIAVLCYYTIIALAVFQPMKKQAVTTHET